MAHNWPKSFDLNFRPNMSSPLSEQVDVPWRLEVSTTLAPSHLKTFHLQVARVIDGNSSLWIGTLFPSLVSNTHSFSFYSLHFLLPNLILIWKGSLPKQPQWFTFFSRLKYFSKTYQIQHLDKTFSNLADQSYFNIFILLYRRKRIWFWLN